MSHGTVPQGFLDQVNAVFDLKITAEARPPSPTS